MVHKGVDDGVGDVVDEVEVEDDDVVGKHPHGHQPGGQERHDEDECHHEQHSRRADVGQEVEIPPLLARLLLGAVQGLSLTASGHVAVAAFAAVAIAVAAVGGRRSVLCAEFHLLHLRHHGDRGFGGRPVGPLAASPFPPPDDGAVDEGVDDEDGEEREEIEGSVELLVVVQVLHGDDVAHRLTSGEHFRLTRPLHHHHPASQLNAGVAAAAAAAVQSRGSRQKYLAARIHADADVSDGRVRTVTVSQRRNGAQGKSEDAEAEDRETRSSGRDGVQERVTDAEVAVHGDGDHDEGGKRDVEGDEELVQLAQEVQPQVAVCGREGDGQRDDDGTGEDVGPRQGQDEDGGRHLLHR